MKALQASTVSVPPCLKIQCVQCQLANLGEEESLHCYVQLFDVYKNQKVCVILKKSQKSQAHTHTFVDSCSSVRYRALRCFVATRVPIFFAIMENLSALYIEDESQQGDESTTNLYQAAYGKLILKVLIQPYG